MDSEKILEQVMAMGRYSRTQQIWARRYIVVITIVSIVGVILAIHIGEKSPVTYAVVVIMMAAAIYGIVENAKTVGIFAVLDRLETVLLEMFAEIKE